MTKSAMQTILSNIGVSSGEWTTVPTVSHFATTADSFVFTKETTDYVMQYYFDMTHELIAERAVSKTDTTKIISNIRIMNFDTILGVVLMNAYSESADPSSAKSN